MIGRFAQTVAGAVPAPQRKPTVILLSSTLLMLTWWYFGSPRFYLDHFAAAGAAPSAGPAVYTFVSCFFLLGVVPALIVKGIFREPLAQYGVQWGDRVRTPRSLLILGPLFILGGYLSSRTPAVAAYYPIDPTACDSAWGFASHASWYLLFYLAWEFHFRGYLQFGLRDSFGAANAVLIQVMASSLLHLGKPGVEAFSAIAGGILWGWIAYRTRSLVSVVGQHYLLGISLDFFLCRG